MVNRPQLARLFLFVQSTVLVTVEGLLTVHLEDLSYLPSTWMDRTVGVSWSSWWDIAGVT